MRRIWKERKIDHLSLRALALLLAVALWFVATGRPQSNLSLGQRVIEAEVAVENVRDDLEFTASPTRVELGVEGPRLILPFEVQDVSAFIDLSGLGPGRHDLPVQVRAPASVSVRNVRPESVSVLLEERKMRRVEVQVALRGVPRGVRVAVVEVRPETMEVYGPASRVDRVAHILAEASPGLPDREGATLYARAVPVDPAGAPVDGVVTETLEVEVVLAFEADPPLIMEGD